LGADHAARPPQVSCNAVCDATDNNRFSDTLRDDRMPIRL